MESQTLAEEIGVLLKEHKLSLGLVESVTGGLISHLITGVAGSSEYYRGSVTAYNNEVKTSVVRINKATLDEYGAVSRQVVEEMARGGQKLLAVDICLADTGIAGPGGAVSDKPVGLFFLGLCYSGEILSQEHNFSGSREQNKISAALAALSWLKEYLETL